MRLALLLAVLSFGCGKSTRDRESPENTKEAEYKKRTRAFLEEARAGAKMLASSPLPGDLQEKAKQLRDLHSRVPDAPPGIDPEGVIEPALKSIVDAFGDGIFLADRALGWLKLARDFPNNRDVETYRATARDLYETDLKLLAKRVRELVDAVGKKVGE